LLFTAIKTPPPERLQLGKSLERAASIKNAFLVIAGDFNLPGCDWKGNTFKSNTQYSSIHYQFTEILDDNGLAQIGLMLSSFDGLVVRAKIYNFVTD
jgi:hypothetical protein